MASKKFTELPAVTADPDEDSVIAVSVFDGATTYTSEKLTLKQVNKASSNAFATLTDGATVTWDMDVSDNAEVTLGGNRTLALPANSLVLNDGGGAITLSTTAGDVDVLSYIYDGTDYLWTFALQYS